MSCTCEVSRGSALEITRAVGQMCCVLASDACGSRHFGAFWRGRAHVLNWPRFMLCCYDFGLVAFRSPGSAVYGHIRQMPPDGARTRAQGGRKLMCA